MLSFGSGGGGGGVTGLTSAAGGVAIADNALIRGDGTTGIQGGSVTLSDTTGVFTQTTVNGGFTFTPNGTGNFALSTGQFLAPDGTKALPGFSWGSDPDTGWYKRGVDRITGSIGGVAVIEANQSITFLLHRDMRFGFASDAVDAAADDVSISRSAAGVLLVNTTSADGLGLLAFGNARCRGFTTTAAAATTTEYPTTKDWGLHLNTTTGVVSLVFNNAGAIKTVALA